jgi:hypothetical protein
MNGSFEFGKKIKKRTVNKKSSNFYRVKYPDPIKDPFYKALILVFLHLRSTTEEPDVNGEFNDGLHDIDTSS